MKRVIHIKEHTRRLKSGRVIKVRAYDRNYFGGKVSVSTKHTKIVKRGDELKNIKLKKELKDKNLEEENILDMDNSKEVESTPKKVSKRKKSSSTKKVYKKPKEKEEKPKEYKPTKEDYLKGYHLFSDGSVKYFPKKKVKHKKDDGLKWTKEERKRGFKTVDISFDKDTNTISSNVYYTDAMKRQMALNDAN